MLKGVRKPLTRYLFEKQLMDVYTRAVYNLFHERLFESGAFGIKQSTEHPTKYYLHHYNQEKKSAWSRHIFLLYQDTVRKMGIDPSRIKPTKITLKGVIPGVEA